MSVKLDWKNPNTAISKGVRIYRSLALITELNVGDLLATLPGDALTYTDVTAPMNTVIYYQLVFVGLDDQLVPCGSQPYGHFPGGTGPGQQSLLRGSWGCGYFGTVPVADIYTPDELRTVLGTATIAGAVAAITNAKMTLWHKFVFEGKILFYPQGALISGINWAAIYNKGWIYGIDSNGPGLVTLNVPTPVNQKVLITKGAFTYRVRTPKGLNKPVDKLYPTANVLADLIGSEWDSLVSGLYSSGHILAFNIAGVGRLESLVGVTATVEFNNLFSLTQHVVAANGTPHSRGYTNIPDQDSISGGGSGSNTYWAPVLQLEYV